MNSDSPQSYQTNHLNINSPTLPWNSAFLYTVAAEGGSGAETSGREGPVCVGDERADDALLQAAALRRVLKLRTFLVFGGLCV